MKNKKYLAFDLSATGTTAFFDGEKFKKLFSKQWTEHMQFILSIRKEYPPHYIILYEQLYPNLKNNQAHKDMIDYARLLGTLEFHYKNVFSVNSSVIKDFRKKIIEGKKNIQWLTYRVGRSQGWFYQSKKLIDHEVDALIIYFYGSAKLEGKIYIN